ncbi:haloalkane dehalogenase [Limimonas halophila]|uniref:Haloalkane dehalogenase n=1 Tax=Limimonas halophila TaxID=1082479 RepID=A0A1G7Q1H6_9PROT|nr:alpha/beta hydrolase [Limimonas halophila]SDF91480.1 haloalkane dehalogenase [Limimonas halophila]
MARAVRHQADGASWLESGNGPAVVLLHGIPDTGEAWRPVAEALAPHFRCVAPDLPGFGQSAPPTRLDPLDGFAAITEGMLQRMGTPRPFDLVVHDVGGAYGLAWAVRYPDAVRRLVILNTSFSPDRRWHAGARLLRMPVLGEIVVFALPRRPFIAAMRRASNNNLSKETCGAVFDAFGPTARQTALRLYRALDPASFRGWETALQDLTARIPALVLWGDRDPYLPVTFSVRFGAAAVQHFGDLGHWPHREAPHLVAAALSDFLAAPRASHFTRRRPADSR